MSEAQRPEMLWLTRCSCNVSGRWKPTSMSAGDGESLERRAQERLKAAEGQRWEMEPQNQSFRHLQRDLPGKSDGILEWEAGGCVKPLAGSAGSALAGPLTWRRSPPDSGHTQSKPERLVSLANTLRMTRHSCGNFVDCREHWGGMGITNLQYG